MGEELFIGCRLSARGAEDPGHVRVLFRVGGTVIRELRVVVTPGTPVTFGEHWTPRTAGAHEVGCEVLPEPRSADTSRGDNVRKRTVKVVSRDPGPAVAAPAPKRATPSPRPAPPTPGVAAAAQPDSPASPDAPVPEPATPGPPAPSASGPGAVAQRGTAAPPAPAPPAPAPPGPVAAKRGTAAAPEARPDLEITRATTVADPGCGQKSPVVTVRATVRNVGEAAFVPPGSMALAEATVRIANQGTLTGRTTVPRLAPGAATEIEVVAKRREAPPGAGGLPYSVVLTVNSASKVPEVTLDNNGEYVKAVFPPC
ncbi:MAG TPA: CARDB domain-containing protein [Methylomirabilota bacterium]